LFAAVSYRVGLHLATPNDFYVDYVKVLREAGMVALATEPILSQAAATEPSKEASASGAVIWGEWLASIS
jgi:hypothetical protein